MRSFVMDAAERLHAAYTAARGSRGDLDLELARAALEQERKRSANYLSVLEDMQRDRDRWRELYELQAREHAAAQAMLERWIERLLLVCKRLFTRVNELHEKLGLPPCDWNEQLDGWPHGTADRYRTEMGRLGEEAKRRSAPVTEAAEGVRSASGGTSGQDDFSG